MAEESPRPADAVAPVAILVLASGSPRRRELLSAMGVDFTVRPAEIDESVQAGEAPVAYVERLARAKAMAAAAPGEVVLAADTVVDLDGTVFAKPADADEARRTLATLSGRRHRVHTGVAVARDGRVISSVTTTEVTFRELSTSVIDDYVATGEPLDKAGAYGLQGRGGRFVAALAGSASNVVGLPMAPTAALLSAAGLDIVTWGPPRA